MLTKTYRHNLLEKLFVLDFPKRFLAHGGITGAILMARNLSESELDSHLPFDPDHTEVNLLISVSHSGPIPI